MFATLPFDGHFKPLTGIAVRLRELEALAGTEHLVVAATGGSGTAALRERFPADKVLVEDFVDFARVFARTRLFV